MDLRRISGIVLIVFAVALAIEYFNIFTLPFPTFMIASLILVVHQGYALIRNITSGGIKFMGVFIPLLFSLLGLMYFIPLPYIPSTVISNLKIVVGLVLLLEGLYSMH